MERSRTEPWPHTNLQHQPIDEDKTTLLHLGRLQRTGYHHRFHSLRADTTWCSIEQRPSDQNATDYDLVGEQFFDALRIGLGAIWQPYEGQPEEHLSRFRYAREHNR